MILSARQGDLNAIQECLKEDVPINHQDDLGNSALHMASANGHEDCVRFLIEQEGVDINL
jgi:ankyrin repeat protein